MRTLSLCLILLCACAAPVKKTPAPAVAPGVPRPDNGEPERSRSLYALWSKINKPLPGPASSIGATSAGCLRGAIALTPLHGRGYEVMRPSRGRYYGHPILVRFLRDLAKSASRKGITLLVGDMGRPRGGPMLSGHMSHQNGLDVDIWWAQKRKVSAKDREELSAASFLDGDKLSKSWNHSQRTMLKMAADDPRVDRIFVHPLIKKALCQSEHEAAWLRKIRAWWGHDDHMHVRLACPAGDMNCKPQEPVAPGSGCEAEDFLWWFSDEAKKEEERRKLVPPEERLFPDLPEQCSPLTHL